MNQNQSTLIARVASLSLLAFLIIGSFGIARPTIDSLYLKHYPASSLPLVWIATAIFMAVALAIYNRFNQRHSLFKIFGVACLISAALLVTCLLAYRQGFSGSLFFLNIWKEIYVVVLIEIFWSFSHVVFSMQKARWIYGMLLVCGSFGGFVCNMLIGNIAYMFGTQNIIWAVLPLLLCCWLISVLFARRAADAVPHKEQQPKSDFFSSLTVVRKSRYLVPLLFMIAVIQIATTLIDYEFNSVIQQNYLDDDARTAILGRTHGVVDLLAISLQVLTGPILLLLGVSKTLMTVPLVVGLALMSSLVWPQLSTVLITKVASKCFDYSIFRASKEILYIPLSHREKTQGKALIDILVYRIAKGSASILILGLIYFGWDHAIMFVSLLFLIMWFVLTYTIIKRYRTVVSAEQEFRDEEPTCIPQEKNADFVESL